MNRDDLEAWRKVVKAAAIARRPERPHMGRSGSAPVKDVYTALDVSEDATSELPGVYPFTRGVQPTMYRAAHWTMRQYAGFATAAESNKRYRYLLSQGTTGLSVAFDLPTQMGYDSTDEMANGEVGKVGVAIDTIDDMRALFSDIPLDKVSTSMTINSTAAILLAMYVAVAKEQGADISALRGTIQNDILKEYMARGTYIFPPRPSMRLITDIFGWCATEVPRWNTISISGYHIREAGCTAAQELAFTLADGVAYVEAAVASGLDVDAFAPRLSFFFNAHNNLLEEVAKFRAARRMWAELMQERFGAKSDRSKRLRFHTQTAGSTLAASQIDNNVVRVTLQALAAALGGTQSLHTNSRDEALALPSAESATLALRSQQVIAYESGISDFVDPLGGSYAVESLTDELQATATALMREIDEMGGMVSAIEQGFPQRHIQDAAYRDQIAIDTGEAKVVGVNCFAEGTAEIPPLLKVDDRVETEQCARLQAFKSARDQAAVKHALDEVVLHAKDGTPLMPAIFNAVSVGCSVGEVSHALRDVFGIYQEVPVI
jgi:methylmalonyl-CoA mutase N-terminal domain/subunit